MGFEYSGLKHPPIGFFSQSFWKTVTLFYEDKYSYFPFQTINQ